MDPGDEKEAANVEVNTSKDSSGNQYIGDEHVELKKFTTEEIEASGKWYDKRIVPWLPQYSDGMVQVVMLAFVVFMTPGMYNALTGIGASIDDVKTSDHANVALYSTFATIGFFGGTICNYIGVRASLIFGGTGYALYSGSLLSFLHNRNKGFVIFAGAYLGICAGCLWAAQGSIILSYSSEDRKGFAIVLFWVIFNLGGVIGSIIPLANNIDNKGFAVNDGTYIAFIVLMLSGCAIASLMLPMSKVWKADKTRVTGTKHPHYKEEILGLYRLLIKEPKVVILFPMFFASNWFYTYHFNDVNAARFSLRARSLNSLLYWSSQMIGSLLIGFVLDWKRFRRSIRARIAYVIIFVVGMAIWGGGLKFQLGYTRADTSVTDPKLKPIDFKDGAYIGPMFLYIFYGMYDAIFQTFILWTLGSLSNNPKKVSYYAGFYKGIQSAGAAVAWSLDSHSKPYIDMFASSWALVHGSLLVALPLIWFKITDTTEVEKDGVLDLLDEDELVVVKSASVAHQEV